MKYKIAFKKMVSLMESMEKYEEIINEELESKFGFNELAISYQRADGFVIISGDGFDNTIVDEEILRFLLSPYSSVEECLKYLKENSI